MMMKNQCNRVKPLELEWDDPAEKNSYRSRLNLSNRIPSCRDVWSIGSILWNLQRL